MVDASNAAPCATWSEKLLLYGPGLVVGLGAGVVTAHGLFIVAAAAGVPAGIAWLYPIITDGLALVAYGATHCLPGRGTIYAWTIVVLAAGLSGLAQALYLADDTVNVSRAIRLGVGAWPAIAAAVSAHLIYVLGRSNGRMLRGSRADDGRALHALAPNSVPPGVAADADAPASGSGGSAVGSLDDGSPRRSDVSGTSSRRAHLTGATGRSTRPP